MSVLVCESILGKHGSLKFEPVSYVSASMWKQAYLQRKNEQDNTTQAYLQRKGERENYGNVTLAMVTFHCWWNRSPALPLCKELRSKSPKFTIEKKMR